MPRADAENYEAICGQPCSKLKKWQVCDGIQIANRAAGLDMSPRSQQKNGPHRPMAKRRNWTFTSKMVRLGSWQADSGSTGARCWPGVGRRRSSAAGAARPRWRCMARPARRSRCGRKPGHAGLDARTRPGLRFSRGDNLQVDVAQRTAGPRGPRLARHRRGSCRRAADRPRAAGRRAAGKRSRFHCAMPGPSCATSALLATARRGRRGAAPWSSPKAIRSGRPRRGAAGRGMAPAARRDRGRARHGRQGHHCASTPLTADPRSTSRPGPTSA